MADLKASVIIYTYDRRDYIIRALDSVLNQNVPKESYEIIVVKGFLDEEIDKRISSHAEKNLYINEKGHGKKLAAGIRASSGDIIFFLDDDDEFTNDKLEICFRYFKDDNKLIMLHNSISTISESGSILREERGPNNAIIVDTERLDKKETSSLLRYRTNWYSSCMSFRKDALLGALDTLEGVTQSVDPILFFIALSTSGTICNIPDKLTKYRVHRSTTNYAIPFNEYIARRKEFYSRSNLNFQLALDLKGFRSSRKIIGAMKTQMETISMILDSQIRRGGLFSQMLRYARTANIAFTRYQYLWLAFAMLRILSYRLSMWLYYNYYAKQFKHVL